MILFLCALISTLHAAVPPGLREIYQLAEKRSEVLDIAESRKQQAQERKDQALGALFPNLNARYNYQEIDPPPGPRSPFTRLNQYSALVNLNQPLYRAAAYPAHRYTKEDLQLQARLVESAGLGLWQEVGQAYYDAWIGQRDVQNLQQLLRHSEERVRDLRERARLGRSRQGDLLQAEAQLGTVQAEIARAQQREAQALERLGFLAGVPQRPLFGDLPATVSPTPTLADLLERAHQRPDVLAKAQEVKLAEAQISSAKAGHMPSVDFNSNYYLERTGVLQDSQWDIGLAVNVPLYQGGTVSAQVREAVERHREAVLAHALLKRQVERDIRVLWQASRALDQVLAGLKGAVAKAESTWTAGRRDYGYGLVTNLDVLLSLNSFISTRQGYERAVLEKELIALQLQLAAGERP